MTTTNNLTRVEQFVAAWNRIDLDAVTAAMAPDVFYHNIPMEPQTGRDAIGASLRAFVIGSRIDAIEWTIHHIAERDGIVLTERTDRFRAGGTWIAVRVMGIFEFDADGLISAWRDYFDLAEFTGQLSGATS